MIRRFLDFMAQPWWAGCSTLIGVVVGLGGITLAGVIFVVERNDDIDREAAQKSHISYEAEIIEDPGGHWWTLFLEFTNDGPAVAQQASVRLEFPLAGTYAPNGYQVRPGNRISITREFFREYPTAALDGGPGYSCELGFSVDSWQVGEQIQVWSFNAVSSLPLIEEMRANVIDGRLSSPERYLVAKIEASTNSLVSAETYNNSPDSLWFDRSIPSDYATKNKEDSICAFELRSLRETPAPLSPTPTPTPNVSAQ